VDLERAQGVVLAAAVGDALGAPYEFGPAGRLSAEFPTAARGPSTELRGGGSLGWEPGEWTDDTQLALHLAASLVTLGRFDPADVWGRFQAWAVTGPPDIGLTTGAVLGSGRPWQSAAREHHEAGGRGAGNGSVMRHGPMAVWAAPLGPDEAAALARAQSMLTHGDPLAGEGCVVIGELVRLALVEGVDLAVSLEAAVAAALELVPAEHRSVYAEVLAPSWTPAEARVPNGVVWPTVGTAVWALRSSTSLEQALRRAVDVGGDTDTVACVTGQLAGAAYGVSAVPVRWASRVRGLVPGDPDPVARDGADLSALALRLAGVVPRPLAALAPEPLGPREVVPGLLVGDLRAASLVDDTTVVVSLCRTGDLVRVPDHLRVHLVDGAAPADNPRLSEVVDDVLDEVAAWRQAGRAVLVHCHHGASRTGLFLRAWLQRERGLGYEEALTEASRRWEHTSTWNARFEQELRRRGGGRAP